MRKAISVVTSLLLLFGAVFVSQAREHVGILSSAGSHGAGIARANQFELAARFLLAAQQLYRLPESTWSGFLGERHDAAGHGDVLYGCERIGGDGLRIPGGENTPPNILGTGYIYAGINIPLNDNRGKLLLVVDKHLRGEFGRRSLSRLQQDLAGDGWTVIRQDVGRNDSVASVKNLIKAQYNADPSNVKAVFPLRPCAGSVFRGYRA